MTPGVLIVQGSSDLIQILCEYFRASGFRCSGARSTSECFEMLGSATYDALLIDLIVPSDAPSVIDHCVARGIAVVVLTALDEALARKYCPNGIPVLQKPVGLDEIVGTVRAAITKPKA